MLLPFHSRIFGTASRMRLAQGIFLAWVQGSFLDVFFLRKGSLPIQLFDVQQDKVLPTRFLQCRLPSTRVWLYQHSCSLHCNRIQCCGSNRASTTSSKNGDEGNILSGGFLKQGLFRFCSPNQSNRKPQNQRRRVGSFF